MSEMTLIRTFSSKQCHSAVWSIGTYEYLRILFCEWCQNPSSLGFAVHRYFVVPYVVPGSFVPGRLYLGVRTCLKGLYKLSCSRVRLKTCVELTSFRRSFRIPRHSSLRLLELPQQSSRRLLGTCLVLVCLESALISLLVLRRCRG